MIETRPWGNFRVLESGDGYVVKLLTILPGKRLSLQSHEDRVEQWIVIHGDIVALDEDEEHVLGPGDSANVPRKAKHRIENRGEYQALVLELQTGDCREDDITRHADDYGRPVWSPVPVVTLPGTTVELSSLVGEHLLTGAEFGTDPHEYGEAMSLRFCIDGIVYAAREDPDDGYRSSMRDLIVSNRGIANHFAPVRVLATYRTTGGIAGKSDVLDFTDCVTGKIVLSVGTEDVDDYYPSFVGTFHPEHMSINVGR